MLYTKFEICEFFFIFRNFFGLPSQALYVDKSNFKKSLHILEDNASDVQAVKMNKWLTEFCLKYNKITWFEYIFYTIIWWWP